MLSYEKITPLKTYNYGSSANQIIFEHRSVKLSHQISNISFKLHVESKPVTKKCSLRPESVRSFPV